MKPVFNYVYIYDEQLADATNSIPHLANRSSMVHELIKAYGLLRFLQVRCSKPATKEDLLTFHSRSYLEYLENSSLPDSENGESYARPDTEQEEFGLGHDCPTFNNMMSFACKITGGTLTAAQAINEGAKVAINWCGGWHHAQRNEASGFCYVNDIVIGIQHILKQFSRVLYIDLDSHHGDGVENAFSYSDKVLTLSLHHYEPGYFPGTGTVEDIGFSKGKYHSVNVPLHSGIVDKDYNFIFDRVFKYVRSNFEACAIVVQCGSDCLAGDPLGSFNLTEKSLIHCVKTIMKADLPMLFLGGGGYVLSSAAKAWTALTCTILGLKIPCDIPDHDFFPNYGPDFTMGVSPGLRKNENSPEYVEKVLKSIEGNLQTWKKRSTIPVNTTPSITVSC